MAIFEIEGPDGAIYEVDAPDEQSAIAGFQQMIGAPPHTPDTEAQETLRAMNYQPPRDPDDKSYTGSLWPVSYDREGSMSFDSNAGLLGVIKNAIMAPGRAMSGELQVTGPDGRTSPEAIEQAFNFA